MAKEYLTTGIVLFAHGSSVEEANHGVRELAQKVEAAGLYQYVRAAFPKQSRPDLSRAVQEAIAAGIYRVIVVPYFLTMGIHLRRDLSQLVAAAKRTHPDVEIEVGQSLEGHPLMPSIVLGRVQEVLDGARWAVR